MYTIHPESGKKYTQPRRLCKVMCHCGEIVIIQKYKFEKDKPKNCGCSRQKYTDKELIKLASNYTDRSMFIKEEYNAYSLLGIRGLRKEACKHMKGKTSRFKDFRLIKGIYFLYSGPEIVYIGKSGYCIADRLSSHILGTSGDCKKEFDKVIAYEINNDTDMHIAEIYLINRHTPKYNADALGKSILTLTINNLDSIIDREITWHS